MFGFGGARIFSYVSCIHVGRIACGFGQASVQIIKNAALANELDPPPPCLEPSGYAAEGRRITADSSYEIFALKRKPDLVASVFRHPPNWQIMSKKAKTKLTEAGVAPAELLADDGDLTPVIAHGPVGDEN